MRRFFRWLDRYLELSERMGALLFGLVMVMIITIGARSLLADGEETTGDVLWAIVGGNLAWGIIQGWIFAIESLFERGRIARAILAVQRAGGDETALPMIREEFNGDLVRVASDEERARLYEHILGNVRKLELPKTRVVRADLYGAFVVFLLVSACAIPAIAPFLFFRDPRVALRISNLLVIISLFLVGYRWAGDTDIPRWKAGLTMMVAGIVMSVIGELLGG